MGAGDTFNAGIMKWLMDEELLTTKLISELTLEQLRDMLDAGISLATHTCSQIGAEPPWVDA